MSNIRIEWKTVKLKLVNQFDRILELVKQEIKKVREETGQDVKLSEVLRAIHPDLTTNLAENRLVLVGKKVNWYGALECHFEYAEGCNIDYAKEILRDMENFQLIWLDKIIDNILKE